MPAHREFEAHGPGSARTRLKMASARLGLRRWRPQCGTKDRKAAHGRVAARPTHGQVHSGARDALLVASKRPGRVTKTWSRAALERLSRTPRLQRRWRPPCLYTCPLQTKSYVWAEPVHEYQSARDSTAAKRTPVLHAPAAHPAPQEPREPAVPRSGARACAPDWPEPSDLSAGSAGLGWRGASLKGRGSGLRSGYASLS